MKDSELNTLQKKVKGKFLEKEENRISFKKKRNNNLIKLYYRTKVI